jgi:hypothetical protein
MFRHWYRKKGVSLNILQGLVVDPIKERCGHRRLFIKIQSAVRGKPSRDTQKLAGVLQFTKSSIVFYNKGVFIFVGKDG